MNKIENKITYFLVYLDKRLYTKRKYFLGLFRDIGHYLGLYPLLLRSGIVGIGIWQFWNDTKPESIIAKIIVAGIFYSILRWVIPRRSYESS